MLIVIPGVSLNRRSLNRGFTVTLTVLEKKARTNLKNLKKADASSPSRRGPSEVAAKEMRRLLLEARRIYAINDTRTSVQYFEQFVKHILIVFVKILANITV